MTRPLRPSTKELCETGRILRQEVPRSALATMASGPRDPLVILEEQNATRLPELTPLRAERMSQSAFAFYRGTAALMAADLAQAPTTGINVAACGDAHVSNFGFYASRQRRLVFDLNDFDEAASAPWEWDLKRLVTSIIVGGRDSSRSDSVIEKAAVGAVRAYRAALLASFELSPLERYYTHIDAEGGADRLDGKSRRVVKSAIKAAQRRTGERAVRRLTGAITLLLITVVMSVVEGANDTLTVTFNDQVLGLTESGAGLLAGAYGIGLAIGGVTIAGLARRRMLAPVVLGGALVMGLAQASVALLGTLGPTVALLIVIGVGVSMIIVSARTLLQRSTDDAVLSRVMGVQEGVELLGLTFGAIVGPFLVGLIGPSRAFLPLGALVAVFGLITYATIRGLDTRTVPKEKEIALLCRVPFLQPLQPFELERLARRATWLDVSKGERVVTQGEVGDSFYVVDSGELSVTVDGVVRRHRMGPGDGFGEIALICEMPRTATVTATTTARLLRVSAEDFLSTVVPNARGARLARTLAEARLRSDEHPDALTPDWEL